MARIFERSPYGKEHKLVVRAKTKPKIKDADVLSFDEEFEHYKLTCTGKYKKWATKEGFQLEYNSNWEDLKVAFFVYPYNDTIKQEVINKLKVIEVC